MAIKSPARSRNVDDSKSPMRDNTLTDSHSSNRSPVRSINKDYLPPKSLMRDRFLNDLGTIPLSRRTKDVSGSATWARNGGGIDELGTSPLRTSNVSRSPLRRRNDGYVDEDDKTPVRSRNVSRSPMKGDVFACSSENMREENELESDYRVSMEEEVRVGLVTQKTSFNQRFPPRESASRSEFNDFDTRRRRRTWREQFDERGDQISRMKEFESADELGRPLGVLVDGDVHGIVPGNEIENRNWRSRGEYDDGFSKSREIIDRFVDERDEVEAICNGNQMPVSEQRGAATSSSYYPHYPAYAHGDPCHAYESSKGFGAVRDLNMERVELLRKYMDLKDRLSRIGDVSVEPRDMMFDKRFPLASGQNMEDMSDFYPPLRSNFGGIALYDDPYLRHHHVPRGPPLYKRTPRSEQLVHGHIPEWLMDFDRELSEAYSKEAHVHHSLCRCSVCYANNRKTHLATESIALPNRRSPSGQVSDSGYNSYGPRLYDPRPVKFAPQQRVPYMRRSSNTDPDTSPVETRHARRVPVPNLNKRSFKPIDGGSPFVICCKCFELLKLPRRILEMEKNERKFQCGACSEIIPFDPKSKKSISYLETSPNYTDIDDGRSEVLNEPCHERHVSYHASSTNVESYECENTTLLSSSSSSSKEEQNPDGGSVQISPTNSAEIPLKKNLVPPPPGSPLRDTALLQANRSSSGGTQPKKDWVPPHPPSGSPLQEHLDYSTVFNPSQTPSKPKVMVQEQGINILSDKPSNAGLSEESGEVSREDPVEEKQDKRSLVSSFKRWGFGGAGRTEVYVNGEPIPDRLLKRAEKLAGPIKPGDYWYDTKAGFWGVMGYHCFGIIPPFIPEFTFPLPTNCAGGNTGVYVNGRELYKRDLDILAIRGLPTTSSKHYSIDMSGEVVDETTKEFVINLGKLAPTVEKTRRGFGMQVPDGLH